MLLSAMLRIHFMPQRFGYGDPAMEEAWREIPLLRRFAGRDAFEDTLPDESGILRFRHLLEKHDLEVALFAELNGLLAQKGLTMKRGTMVDAALIAAPSSTKNPDKQRDPEMTQTKKGDQRRFGMKAPLGVDVESGRVHTVECATAKVADIAQREACLHSEEAFALGDRGYHKTTQAVEPLEKEGDLFIVTPSKKPAGGS